MVVRDAESFIRAVGRRVGELRADAGMTQAGFAEHVGLTTRHVQRIELGTLNLTLRSILRLAIALGVEPSAILAPPSNRTTKRGRPPRPKPRE